MLLPQVQEHGHISILCHQALMVTGELRSIILIEAIAQNQENQMFLVDQTIAHCSTGTPFTLLLNMR